VIRPVERKDAIAWSAMRSRLWPEARTADLIREARAFADGAPEMMVDAAFLAEDDATSRPLGFIELSIRNFADGSDSMPIPHVEGWYVEPSARRRGIGRALMDAAAAWARERGYTELASETEVHNAASQDAHGRCGFEETERLVKFRKPLT
jgi:aminoglycoside 6'-N-acetyltransferase I